jgi:enoyl-CoA hydratase/carnithine racemase
MCEETTNMKCKTLLVSKKEGIGIITLHRPEKLNAYNRTLIGEFDSALVKFEQDEKVKAVIITGSGERAFSAGADIYEMTELSEPEQSKRSAQHSDWIWHLATYQKPTIGAINGLAYGGGALLSSLVDIRIGCERTSFRFLSAVYGRVNSTWSLPVIVGWPMAKERMFTGREIKAKEALRIGLLNRLVPSSQLMKTALELGRAIAANDTVAVRSMKAILNTGIGMSLKEMMLNEANIVSESGSPPPAKESFKPFLERKRK